MTFKDLEALDIKRYRYVQALHRDLLRTITNECSPVVVIISRELKNR